MRANLARHARHLVVRRAHAPSCAAYANPARRRPASRQLVCKSFERTFLDILFRKAPREIRQPEYEPGWMQIMVWRSRMLDKLRPPPRTELLTAWKSLMQSKIRNHSPMNSTQALQCRRLLEYLTKLQKDDQNMKKLAAGDLEMLRRVLLEIEPYERTQNHLDLVKALHAVWTSGDFNGKSRDPSERWKYLVQGMARFGGSTEALSELYSKWEDPAYSKYTAGEERVFGDIARGLAREGQEQKLVQLMEFLEKNGVAYTPELQEVITVFYAQQNRVPETQQWFTKQLAVGHARPRTYTAVASFSSRNGLEEWITPHLLELGQLQPRKSYWGALFQSMLLVGMGLEEVKAMMSHMVGQNGPLRPDATTINSMLRAAEELADPVLAGEISSLAGEQSIRLTGETHLILISMHIATSNLAEAQTAFREFQNAGSISNDASAELWAEYAQVMNRYLLLLSQQSPADFKYILRLLNAGEEDRLPLTPETVAKLCLRFLENDQHFDVMDILSVHAFTYSEAQREVVQSAFLTFCLDPNTSTSRSWGAYQLLQQFFQDLSFERRVELLRAFFDRKRPDMATLIIGHMRQHRTISFQPTLDTYVQCFEGFSQNPDREGTEQVHNMLKMDTRIQPNTRLNTALMLAYAACERPLKALDFWDEITSSPEGPSYSSLEAIFFVLERKSGGDKKAREIWDKMEAMDLEVPPSVYNAYVGSIAAQGNEKETRGLIMKMASYTGSEPDAMTLGVAYNALPGEELQKGFREWAEKRYRQAWQDLSTRRRKMSEYGLCHYKLNRVVKA